MSNSKWEADQMLNAYILDYLKKNNFLQTATAFEREAKIPTELVLINAPEGFVLEWWAVFWDIFKSRRNHYNNNHNSNQNLSTTYSQPYTPVEGQKLYNSVRRIPQVYSRESLTPAHHPPPPTTGTATSSATATTTATTQQPQQLPPQSSNPYPFNPTLPSYHPGRRGNRSSIGIPQNYNVEGLPPSEIAPNLSGNSVPSTNSPPLGRSNLIKGQYVGGRAYPSSSDPTGNMASDMIDRRRTPAYLAESKTYIKTPMNPVLTQKNEMNEYPPPASSLEDNAKLMMMNEVYMNERKRLRIAQPQPPSVTSPPNSEYYPIPVDMPNEDIYKITPPAQRRKITSSPPPIPTVGGAGNLQSPSHSYIQSQSPQFPNLNPSTSTNTSSPSLQSSYNRSIPKNTPSLSYYDPQAVNSMMPSYSQNMNQSLPDTSSSFTPQLGVQSNPMTTGYPLSYDQQSSYSHNNPEDYNLPSNPYGQQQTVRRVTYNNTPNTESDINLHQNRSIDDPALIGAANVPKKRQYYSDNTPAPPTNYNLGLHRQNEYHKNPTDKDTAFSSSVYFGEQLDPDTSVDLFSTY